MFVWARVPPQATIDDRQGKLAPNAANGLGGGMPDNFTLGNPGAGSWGLSNPPNAGVNAANVAGLGMGLGPAQAPGAPGNPTANSASGAGAGGGGGGGGGGGSPGYDMHDDPGAFKGVW
eukprot:scaffold707_cov240-Pinguiococcus_pyrenoidosus.AAC.15